MFTSIFTVALAAVAIPLLSQSLTQEPLGTDPVVALDYGSFEGVSSNGISSFLGIPYAAPPIGPLRFAAPQPPLYYPEVQLAKEYGPGCLQQTLVINPDVGLPSYDLSPDSSSEDCLSLNVFKPVDAPAGAALPVIFQIHGGGFVVGATSKLDFARHVLARAAALDTPVIYVSANYRLNAFGFLSGEQTLKTGGVNAGLLDQRMALQWTQKYIHLFGGDPSKVTVIGQSAGGASIGLHMVAREGNLEGLFRAGVLQSGSATMTGHYTTGQAYYNQLAELVGCQPTAGQDSSLECLRRAPSEKIVDSVNQMASILGYDSFKLAWQPRVDGEFFTEDPVLSVEAGKVANVPFIAATNDDEGTIFSLSSLNITTNDEFKEYVRFLTGMSEAHAERVAQLYPDDPTQGSPFETGEKWSLSPQYKRIAAFTGDWVFIGPRRHNLQSTKNSQKAWSYNFKIGKDLSFLGAAHGADGAAFSKHPHGFDFLINFAYNMDPNIAVAPDSALPVHWPTYVSLPRGALLEFNEEHGVDLIQDTFRAEPIETLIQIQIELANAGSDAAELEAKNHGTSNEKVKRHSTLYATLKTEL